MLRIIGKTEGDNGCHTVETGLEGENSGKTGFLEFRGREGVFWDGVKQFELIGIYFMGNLILVYIEKLYIVNNNNVFKIKGSDCDILFL